MKQNAPLNLNIFRNFKITSDSSRPLRTTYVEIYNITYTQYIEYTFNILFLCGDFFGSYSTSVYIPFKSIPIFWFNQFHFTHAHTHISISISILTSTCRHIHTHTHTYHFHYLLYNKYVHSYYSIWVFWWHKYIMWFRFQFSAKYIDRFYHLIIGFHTSIHPSTLSYTYFYSC